MTRCESSFALIGGHWTSATKPTERELHFSLAPIALAKRLETNQFQAFLLAPTAGLFLPLQLRLQLESIKTCTIFALFSFEAFCLAWPVEWLDWSTWSLA